jgi:hypothetical protein
LISRGVREEALVHVALCGSVVGQLRVDNVLDRSVENAYFVANKPVYPKI